MRWLLVSSNNRPLGRGERAFESASECRDAIRHLCRNHARAHGNVTAEGASGHWVWKVAVDDNTIAVSSRTYLRQRECAYSLDRFMEAVPTAVLMDEVRVVGGGRI
jgi:hypothetical protein